MMFDKFFGEFCSLFLGKVFDLNDWDKFFDLVYDVIWFDFEGYVEKWFLYLEGLCIEWLVLFVIL